MGLAGYGCATVTAAILQLYRRITGRSRRSFQFGHTSTQRPRRPHRAGPRLISGGCLAWVAEGEAEAAGVAEAAVVAEAEAEAAEQP